MDTCLRGMLPMVWASSTPVGLGAQSFSLASTPYLLLTQKCFHFIIGRDLKQNLLCLLLTCFRRALSSCYKGAFIGACGTIRCPIIHMRTSALVSWVDRPQRNSADPCDDVCMFAQAGLFTRYMRQQSRSFFRHLSSSAPRSIGPQVPDNL